MGNDKTWQLYDKSEAVKGETLNRALSWSDRWSLTINLKSSFLPLVFRGLLEMVHVWDFSLYNSISFIFPKHNKKCSASTSLTGSPVMITYLISHLVGGTHRYTSFQFGFLAWGGQKVTIRRRYGRCDVKILFIYNLPMVTNRCDRKLGRGTWQRQEIWDHSELSGTWSRTICLHGRPWTELWLFYECTDPLEKVHWRNDVSTSYLRFEGRLTSPVAISTSTILVISIAGCSGQLRERISKFNAQSPTANLQLFWGCLQHEKTRYWKTSITSQTVQFTRVLQNLCNGTLGFVDWHGWEPTWWSHCHGCDVTNINN